jgi:hypothetical protein
VHCEPDLGRLPRGPWLMNQAGRLALPLLARHSDDHGG